ncbi:hypothetical protein ACFQ1L_15795 [Phytohabitans flavus]|uniref:hypothetical protein n=1 Tax=Phytohabitans flavus TaxID=1076124 RepID=UPI003637BB38
MRLTPESVAVTPDDQRDSLAAPARDPLWMLARQWQTREFVADDAGTPVQVTIAHETASLRPAGGQAPLAAVEPAVEPEPLPTVEELGYLPLAELGVDFGRRLRDEAVTAARTVLNDAFPFEPADAGPKLSLYLRRIPDPRQLYRFLLPHLGAAGDTGSLPAIAGLDVGLRPGVERACRAWLRWLRTRVRPAAGAGAPAAWDGQRLEYRFRLSAPLSRGPVELVADEYHGGGVDWYTFDSGPAPTGTLTGGTPVTVRPAPVSYPGMPRPRFWELEDGDVNLDALRATDPAGAALASFAQLYSNDWFMVPLSVAPGLTAVTTLRVVDTFGTVTDVPAAAVADGGAARGGCGN